jgi:hypothetical protein
VVRSVAKPVTGVTALVHDGLVGQREQDPVRVERSICGHPAATVSIYPIIPKVGGSSTTSVDAALPLSPMSAQQSRSHRQIRHKLTRAPMATAKLARRPVIGRFGSLIMPLDVLRLRPPVVTLATTGCDLQALSVVGPG